MQKILNYPINGTILQRVIFILTENKVPLNTREIIDGILYYQPYLKETKELENKTAKNVSTILSIHKGKVFIREEKNGINYFTLNKDYR